MAANEVLYKVLIDSTSGEASLVRMRSEVTKTESQFSSLKKNLSSGLSLGFGIGGAQGALSAVKSVLSGIKDEAIEFDANIRNVGSLGVKNYKQIGDELLRQSKTIPKTAGDLANATYQAISAGVDPAKVNGFIEQAAKTAVAGRTTTEDAVNGLTSVLNAYKLKTSEASTVSDQFFGAIKFGKTTFKEMNAGLGQVIPTAAAVGVGFDQVSAAIATMTNQGVPTAQSVTQVRQAMVELQKPGKDLEEVMKRAGVSTADLKNPQIGLIGVLQKVQVEASKQGKSMAQVFSSVEAGSAALLLTGENFEQARKTLENVRGATGSAGEAFDVMNASIENQAQLAQNYISAALIPIAQTLLGGFLKGIQLSQAAFGGLSRFVGENKVALGVLAGIIGIVTLAMNAQAITTAVVTKAKVIWAATTGGVTTAMKLLSLAMAANPIGAVIIGITAAIAVFSLFSSKVKSVGDASADLKESFEEFNKANKEAQQVEVTAQKTDKLAESYDRLSTKTNRTAEEEQELQRVTKDLDEATGGAATTVDNYGNIVGIATDKVRGLTDEQRKLAQEMRNTALQDVKDNTEGLAASIQETAAKLTELRAKLANNDAAGDSFFSRAKDRAIELRKEIRELSGQTAASIKQYAQSLVDANFQNVDAANFIAAGFDPETARRIANEVKAIKGDKEAMALSAQEEADAATKANATRKETKKTEEDLLALSKRLATERTNDYEINRKLSLIRAGQKFTTEEELKLQQQSLANLRDEITKRGLLSNSKYKLKAQLELDTQSLKEIEIKVKLKAELEKLRDDLASGKDAIFNEEIELGIRPKSDGLVRFKEQITSLESEIARTTQEIFSRLAADPLSAFDTTGLALQKKLQDMQQNLLSTQRGYKELSAGISRELSDLRIANITNEEQREIASLGARFEEQLQFVKDAIDAGRELDKNELAKKKQLEIAYQRELLEIRKKYAKDNAVNEVSIADALHKSLLAGIKRFDDLKRKMSEAEIANSRFEFEKRNADLNASLSRGEISEREYRTKLRLMDEERAKFELENNATIWQRIGEGAKSMLSTILDSYTAYFESLAQKYILDVVLATQADRDKLASSVDTSAAMADTSSGDAAGSVKSGNASIFAAATQAAGKAIATLPFPINIAAAIAAGFAITKGLSALRGVLGFATGGIRLGMTGEAGPEVIGPSKDFSQFATQLSLRSAKATFDAIKNFFGVPKGGGFGGDLRVNGNLKGSGRDFLGVLMNEATSRTSETFGVDESIRIHGFVN